ncbi:MAG TPA: hypothetical protein VML96_02490 [Egibacteraceae bacterium]|nr:hypothetical protein [Egibacteraceae bacterium]
MTRAGALYAFLDDLVEEGIGQTLARIADLGVRGVAVAATYHTAKDVLPHRPDRRVVYREGGLHYFSPDFDRYPAGLRPKASWLSDGSADPFTEARSAAAQRGLEFHAWAVFLHNSRLAGLRPDCAVRNAFGDVSRTDLCPASDEVADYAVALASDLARHRPDTVIAESLHYPGAEHGYHHERRFAPLLAVAGQLLGLCFCGACLAAARDDGVDAQAVAALARDEVDRSLAGDADPRVKEATWTAVAALGSEDLLGYLRMRQRIVTDLIGEIAGALRAGGSRLVFMDQVGAAKGYATGAPTGEPAASLAWQLGVDVAQIARLSDEYAALLYARDPGRVGMEAGAYQRALGGSAPLRAVLRPMAPDSDGAGNLAAKLAVLAAADVATVDFYHYGLAPMAAVEAIGQAVAGHLPERGGEAADGAAP